MQKKKIFFFNLEDESIRFVFVGKCLMCNAEKKKFDITGNGPVASISTVAVASSSSRY